jgi:DNA modification methylase
MRDLDSAIGKILQSDAAAFMRKLPGESFDLIVCDGPYAVTTHEWDNVADIQHFNLELLKSFSRLLKPGGAAYLFGKPDCVDFIDYRPFLTLQSRLVWYQPSQLAQGRVSYTNNYDVICYFTKGKAKTFNLDDIRVPQLVELEHRLRCEKVPSVRNGKYGKTVFNPNGKNSTKKNPSRTSAPRCPTATRKPLKLPSPTSKPPSKAQIKKPSRPKCRPSCRPA